VQRRTANSTQGIDSGAASNEDLDHHVVPVTSRQVQRRTAIPVRGIDSCALDDEVLYALDIACSSRAMQVVRRAAGLLLAPAGKKDAHHSQTQ
jgi:hypothetical protein